MAQLFVITIHLFIYGLQILLVPLWYLLGIFIPKVRHRLIFERKRQSTFTDRADLGFEISSQGELEQVAPLINDSLANGLIVQLLYSSPSLNEVIIKMEKEWPGQLYWKRLPLLTLFPLNTPITSNSWSWFKAPRLFFCRYDFFPELVLLAKFKGAFLFSATLKNKALSGLAGFYHRGLYSLFERIYTASPIDVERFKSLGIKSNIDFYDFRQIQILRRLDHQMETLRPLEKLLEVYSRDQRLMLGSCWPFEMSVFESTQLKEDIAGQKIALVLAPHKLGEEFLAELLTEARRYIPDLSPTIIHRDGRVEFGKDSSVIISLLPGVLCEAYSLVDHTFVGGGHGRSVHSLLEPWLAGCEVYCGPKTHRSTEYDLIFAQRPDMIHIVDDPSHLYQTFLESKMKEVLLDTEMMKKNLNEKYDKIMDEFNA